ncbi:MAG: ABC transporter permease [Terracidiphilus sp.]
MSWWRRLFRAGRMDREVDAELRHHFELLVDAKIRSGMTAEEARREARIEFGGHEQVKEDCRESRGTMLVSSIVQDLHFALRQLGKNPGFAMVTIVTLALGIGATTAIFSIFNATLLQPLPYKDPDSLVMLWSSMPMFGFVGPGALTDPDYAQWAQQNQVFEQIAAFRSGQTSNLTGVGVPERLLGVTATASLFPLLGVAPELGRAFNAEEQIPGHENVVLISHQLWARRFASNPEIVGKTIKLDGTDFTVVGIMPAGFQFPNEPDFLIPLVLTGDRSNATDQVVARLKPGLTLQRAAEDVTLIQHRLNPTHPHDDIHLSFAFLKDKMVADIRPALTVLLAAVALVLLIACANVANLFLTRATARRQEIAMRRALGAGRLRIVRQLLTESTLLACLGGFLGLLLAAATRHLLLGLMLQSAAGPGDLQQIVASDIDAWVLGFASLIALATGIVFGLAPALSVSRFDLHSPVRAAAMTFTSESRSRRIRNVLVVGEFSLTLILVVSAGLLLKSFVRLIEVNPGFEPRNVVLVNLELPETRYPTVPRMTAFHDAVLDRAAALPGVRAAATVGMGMLFGGGVVKGDFTLEDRPQPPPDMVSKVMVSPDYFRVLSIPLVGGRAFDRSDTAQSQRIVIVSQSFARHIWPNQQAVGKKIGHLFGEKEWSIVVGVAGDVKQAGLSSDAPLTIYLPYSQGPIFFAGSMTILVRTDAAALATANAVRSAVQSVDPEIPIFDVASMDSLIAKSITQPRFNSVLLALFAALALILAAIGIYGVISYSVAQRQHEIGIRMALGAGPHSMTRMVVKEGAILAFTGIAIGVGGALLITHFIAAFLFATAPTDPATFLGLSIFLALVALAACYIPARRASRVDPMVALRYE